MLTRLPLFLVILCFQTRGQHPRVSPRESLIPNRHYSSFNRRSLPPIVDYHSTLQSLPTLACSLFQAPHGLWVSPDMQGPNFVTP